MINESNDERRYDFIVVGAGAAQPFHYTGTDFLEERDGRVSRLYTFIDQKLFQS